jgi:hypothetical protein
VKVSGGRVFSLPLFNISDPVGLLAWGGFAMLSSLSIGEIDFESQTTRARCFARQHASKCGHDYF